MHLLAVRRTETKRQHTRAIFVYGTLATLGYTIVSKEINVVEGTGCCCEFTLMRVEYPHSLMLHNASASAGLD